MMQRNINRHVGAALVACVVLALGTGCGGSDDATTPAASETEIPAIPEGMREMLGAAAEADGADQEVVDLLKSEHGLAQMGQITGEIMQRTSEAHQRADIMTAEGRVALADELDAIVEEYRARIPDLDPTVQGMVTEMVDDIDGMAADMRAKR